MGRSWWSRPVMDLLLAPTAFQICKMFVSKQTCDPTKIDFPASDCCRRLQRLIHAVETWLWYCLSIKFRSSGAMSEDSYAGQLFNISILTSASTEIVLFWNTHRQQLLSKAVFWTRRKHKPLMMEASFSMASLPSTFSMTNMPPVQTHWPLKNSSAHSLFHLQKPIFEIYRGTNLIESLS